MKMELFQPVTHKFIHSIEMLHRRVSYRFFNQPVMNQSRATSFQRFKEEWKFIVRDSRFA